MHWRGTSVSQRAILHPVHSRAWVITCARTMKSMWDCVIHWAMGVSDAEARDSSLPETSAALALARWFWIFGPSSLASGSMVGGK